MKKCSITPRRILTIAVFGLAMSMTAPIWADSSVDDAIDKRTDLMKDMGKHIKEIKKILGGATDVGTIKEHTAELEKLTSDLATHLKELFPVNSNQGDSAAQPAIWQNWSEFDKIAQSAATKGAALHKANEQGEPTAITTAYKELGEVCKSCHKDYRSEK